MPCRVASSLSDRFHVDIGRAAAGHAEVSGRQPALKFTICQPFGVGQPDALILGDLCLQEWRQVGGPSLLQFSGSREQCRRRSDPAAPDTPGGHGLDVDHEVGHGPSHRVRTAATTCPPAPSVHLHVSIRGMFRSMLLKELFSPATSELAGALIAAGCVWRLAGNASR